MPFNDWVIPVAIGVGAIIFIFLFLKWVIGIQYIPNEQVGVVEKLWGGTIKDGRIIATMNEAGFHPEILRGGLYIGYPVWRWRIHKMPLVTIPQGKFGYCYARDGETLTSGQTLGRVVSCDNYQNARAFLASAPAGQRGRQRAILREGVYAINPALFVVITEDNVFSLRASKLESEQFRNWQVELASIEGFSPLVIGKESDDIGIVTVQDGPPLATGEIIAPQVEGHQSFQDPEAFLAVGGQRGRQFQVITDGTYFINRWFATVEQVKKTVVPIGYVGVVISYYGKKGTDLSGNKFRHGERVAQGERGVWQEPLGPGKYPFNTYAASIVSVPTTNFVLHWVTGRSESHHFDDNLRSIDLVTADAYEPTLPLSLVVHIDYQLAPSVIQRFGDVKQLINQTIDPMLSAYFRDVAHKRTMLDLLQQRDVIQKEARSVLLERFREFDIECVDVLVGKPETEAKDGKIETLLEQLRQRQLSVEQVETYARQKTAAEKQRELEEAMAVAHRQKDLTNSSVEIKIVENQASAQLAQAEMRKKQTIVEAEAILEQARRQAEQRVVTAEAEARQVTIAAKAKSEQEILLGKGESSHMLQNGIAQAAALQRLVTAYGDPRLYALVLAAQAISQSKQPLVPERVFNGGGGGAGGGPNGDNKIMGSNVLGDLVSMLLAQNSVFSSTKQEESPVLQQMADQMVNDAVNVMGGGNAPGDKPKPTATNK